MLCACVSLCVSLSRVRLFATLRPVAHQAPLSTGFPRQEYWNRLPSSPLEDLPDPGIEPKSLYPALQMIFYLLIHIYWGTHVNPWLIHVNVWQKPLQYGKVISLQLIKISGKKSK